jgi:Uma2 family endonuclease
MTEAQFLRRSDDQTRAEWSRGKVELLPPVNTQHVCICGWLGTLMRLFAEAHELGEIFMSRSMIRLATTRSLRLPDLHFVRKTRSRIIGEDLTVGPPDLIVEIVSPDTMALDWRRKYLEYQEARVKEYWVIDPIHE